MGIMCVADGRPAFRAGLVAMIAFALAAPGCIKQMQTDIAENQKRLDGLEEDLEAKRKEL